MKASKFLAVTALLTAAIALTACAAGKAETASSETAQIPNPFVDCDTLEAAAEVAGFSLTAPESVDGYEGQYIQAIEGELLQVGYGSGEQALLVRKGLGSEDISGDYNTYALSNPVQVSGNEVTMKGNDDAVQVATWVSGDYTYAVDVTGTPLTVEAMAALVEQVS